MFFSICTLNAESINEYKTDIYFGNGVWNKQFSINCDEDGSADCSKQELDDLIQEEIIQNDSKLQVKYGEVKLQYNWGKGYMDDVLETYYQLKEANQVNHIEFFALMVILTNGNLVLSSSITDILVSQMPYAAQIEQSNVTEMFQKYYEKSFKHSHRVLLVSHSQGNLFANRVYDTINPARYKNYFANVQVASPASSVSADMGAYTTGFIDPIINPIPGSMDFNAFIELPGGHAFVEAYLASSNTYSKILDYIIAQLLALDKVASKWKNTKEELEI